MHINWFNWKILFIIVYVIQKIGDKNISPNSLNIMVNHHYVERIWRNLFIPNFLYNIYDNEKYYPGEPVNIHKQSLIDIIHKNNLVITTKKRVGVNDQYFVVMENA